MVIRYACKHCNTEIGSIPFESGKDIIRQLQETEHKNKDEYLEYDRHGSLTIRCICEECERSLRLFPDYYALRKWLQ